MMRKPSKPHGGPVPPRPEAPDFMAAYEREKQASRERERPLRYALYGCGSILLVLLLFILLGAFYVPGHRNSKRELEQRQMGDIAYALRDIGKIQGMEGRLKRAPLAEARGTNFWLAGLQKHVIEIDILGKLISLNSPGDARADIAFLEDSTLWKPENCSYTAPMGAELAELLKRKGEQRCVLVTFNARNWENYQEFGVLVLWSDGEKGEWLTFDQAAADWGITAEEWADPAGKLFGIKPPFQHTYE